MRQISEEQALPLNRVTVKKNLYHGINPKILIIDRKQIHMHIVFRNKMMYK